MKTKVIIFLNSMLLAISFVSCLKVPDEEPERKVIIIPDENEPFNTNTQTTFVKNAVIITFIDGHTLVNNPMEGNGVMINIDGQNVTINAEVPDIEVNYVLSGITNAGSVKIYSNYKIGLVLNGVSIQNPTGAAINIQSSKKVSVTLVDNTSNRLIDEGNYQMTEGERMNGAFYSEGQLVFDGAGSLLVYGNYGHAIAVHDYIEMNSGNITVNHANQDGIRCRKYFQMNGGSVNINAKSDGVVCTNGYVTINRGDIKINNGGTGLKSNENIAITGGKVEIESLDSGISAESNIVVTGSEVYCNSGRNGFVSKNGTIAVIGGTIVSSATRNVFDGKKFLITGGTAIGVGSATTAPTASECRQQTIVWNASKFTVGQLISIKSSDDEIMSFKLPKAYSGKMTLVYTSPLLQADTGYTIYKGGTAVATFNTSNMVTTVGK